MQQKDEKTVAKIRDILNNLGLDYKFDQEKNIFMVEVPLEDLIGLNLYTKVLIGVEEDWIVGYIPIFLNTKELGKKLREKLYETLLRANSNISEVAFGLSKEGYVAVNFEIKGDIMDEKVLLSEFLGMVFAIIYFIKEIFPHIPRMVNAVNPFYIS